jgi:hypothetical protein
MKTSIEVLRSSTVASVALQRLGSTETPVEFLETYSGESLAANTLDITASGRTPEDAVARTQAVADAFIADHIARADGSAKAVADALRQRQDQLRAQIADLDRTPPAAGRGIAAGPAADTGGTRALLQSQIDSIESQVQTSALGSPQVAAGTRVLDAPHVTSRGVVTGLVVNTGLGLVLGLGCGLLFAVVASVVGDRPVLRRDIANHLGASVVAQLPGRRRLPSLRSRREARDRERSVASLVRLVDSAPGAVSLLEIGCPQEAVELAAEMAADLSARRPVTLVVDVSGKADRPVGSGAVEVVDGRGFPPPGGVGQRRVLGVASLEPGTPWLDLRRLGAETLLVVRAGRASTTWLHTVARQVADADILVAGVVVVHPDPRDRSDGTLWSALNIALRGRATTLVPRPVAAPVPAPGPAAPVTPAGPLAPPLPSPRPVTAAPAPGTGSRPAAVLSVPRLLPTAANGASAAEDTLPVRAVVPARNGAPTSKAMSVDDALSVVDTVRVRAVTRATDRGVGQASAPVADGPSQPAGLEGAAPAAEPVFDETAPDGTGTTGTDTTETGTTERVPDEPATLGEPAQLAPMAPLGYIAVERPAPAADGRRSPEPGAAARTDDDGPGPDEVPAEEPVSARDVAVGEEPTPDAPAAGEEQAPAGGPGPASDADDPGPAPTDDVTVDAVEEAAPAEEAAAASSQAANRPPATVQPGPADDAVSGQETVWIRPLMPMPSIPPSRNGNGSSALPQPAGTTVDPNGTNGSQPGDATDDGGSGRLPRVPGDKRRRTRPPLRGLRNGDRPAASDQHHPVTHPKPVKEGEKS